MFVISLKGVLTLPKNKAADLQCGLICGGRNSGKSYAAKSYYLHRFRDFGEEFVEIRRKYVGGKMEIEVKLNGKKQSR